MKGIRMPDGERVSLAEWRGRVIEKLNHIENDISKMQTHCEGNNVKIANLESFEKSTSNSHRILKHEIKQELEESEQKKQLRFINKSTAVIGMLFLAAQVLIAYFL